MPEQPKTASEVSAQPPVFVFLHIPKTGGTTLTHEILQHSIPGRSYGFTGIFLNDPKDNKLRDFLALSQQERDQINLILGHVPVGIHQTLSRPCRYITLLRRPLNRMVSLYFQSMKNPKGLYYKSIKDGKLTLEDFLKLKDNENGMTKWLHGLNAFDLAAETTHDQYRSHWRTTETTPEMLEKAKANLREHFILAGVTDRFVDFVFLLHRILEQPSAPYYGLRNKNPLSENALANLSPRVVSDFLERNSLDLALYDYVSQLFEQQWKERLGGMERLRAHYYRLKNAWYQRRSGLEKGS